jgi:hypothetical protein
MGILVDNYLVNESDFLPENISLKIKRIFAHLYLLRTSFSVNFSFLPSLFLFHRFLLPFIKLFVVLGNAY